MGEAEQQKPRVQPWWAVAHFRIWGEWRHSALVFGELQRHFYGRARLVLQWDTPPDANGNPDPGPGQMFLYVGPLGNGIDALADAIANADMVRGEIGTWLAAWDTCERLQATGSARRQPWDG